MDTLPVELLRPILRKATAVPAAVELALTMGSSTSDSEVVHLMVVCIRTKLAISLVSRTFHDIGDEFLLEDIHLRSLTHSKARSLVRLLRTTTANGVYRGWWCRRLSVDITDWNMDGILAALHCGVCCPLALGLSNTVARYITPIHRAKGQDAQMNITSLSLLLWHRRSQACREINFGAYAWENRRQLRFSWPSNYWLSWGCWKCTAFRG